MTMWGIWSGAAGGFVFTDPTEQEVPGEIDRLVADDEDRDDLEGIEMCAEPGHDEQPAFGCQDCAEDDDETCSECGANLADDESEEGPHTRLHHRRPIAATLDRGTDLPYRDSSVLRRVIASKAGNLWYWRN
jgi:hypothetical protein